jgi:glycosyltransferase involved in cell wall biosynthesis
MNPPLSVIIPCKNERDNILACIDSVAQIADEILVVDSGSTDGTQALVVDRDDCRLIETEWLGYAKTKNWAIPRASHEWVLLLDADERATPELREEVGQVLRDVPDDVDGFWIRRRNHFLGHPIRYCGWQGDKVCRLIRRDRCRYREVAVHEEIDIAADRAGWLKQPLLHFTQNSYDEIIEKTCRYTKLSAQESYERGRRPRCIRLFAAGPIRFVKTYLLKGGVLDGIAGLQVCMISAYYAYLKEAQLWAIHHAATRRNPSEESKDDSS